jgi:ligand-binding SRPBCC domain-containing protein
VNPHRLERSQCIPRDRREVFAFFANAANLEAITPPFLHFRILSPMPIEMGQGARIEYALALFGLPFKWCTRIADWVPDVRFVDEQVSGPYALWRHVHVFEGEGGSTTMHDVVEYSEPWGLLGRTAHTLFVEQTLNRIFDFRRDAINKLFRPTVSASSSNPVATEGVRFPDLGET